MVSNKGQCDCCGRNPRILTEIDSGQRLCRTCLRELRPPRHKHLATEKTIENLRNQGISVPNDLSKNDAKIIQAATHNAYHYVLDLWEERRGKRVIYDNLLPGYDQRQQVGRFVGHLWQEERGIVERVAKVQIARDKIALDLYNSNAAALADENIYPGNFKPRLEHDGDYNLMVDYLKRSFHGF